MKNWKEKKKEVISKEHQIDVLKHDMKKQTYPNGAVIYIIRVVNDTLKFDVDEILD